jgi:hypothetical protein
VNWTEYGGKWAWVNFRYYLGICLEVLRKTTKNLNKDSLPAGQNLNLGPPQYKAGVLNTS